MAKKLNRLVETTSRLKMNDEALVAQVSAHLVNLHKQLTALQIPSQTSDLTALAAWSAWQHLKSKQTQLRIDEAEHVLTQAKAQLAQSWGRHAAITRIAAEADLEDKQIQDRRAERNIPPRVKNPDAPSL